MVEDGYRFSAGFFEYSAGAAFEFGDTDRAVGKNLFHHEPLFILKKMPYFGRCFSRIQGTVFSNMV